MRPIRTLSLFMFWKIEEAVTQQSKGMSALKTGCGQRCADVEFRMNSLPSCKCSGHNALKRQFLLLQFLRVCVLNLKLSHRVTERGFNLLPLPALELERSGGIRDHLFDARDVRFELLFRLETLAEFLVFALILGGFYLNFVRCISI